MSWKDGLTIDGQRLDADISGRITGGVRTRTMEGAASLELTLDDSDFLILQSGLLARPGKPNRRQRQIANFDQAAWARFGASRLTLDGWFTRLAGTSGSYTATNTITLTFEDEIALMMRRTTSPIKTSRGQMTRAEFIHWLARRAMLDHGRQFGFYSPQEGQRQKIKTPDDPDRQRGFSAVGLTVKGTAMNESQRRTAEAVLKVADELQAPERAVLAMIVANIGEAEYRRDAVNPTSRAKGLFQILPAYWDIVDPGDLQKGARIFLTVGFTHMSRAGTGDVAGPPTPGGHGAIQIAQGDPSLSPGDIASKVEGSGEDGSFYDEYLDEAQKILAAWGGAGQTFTIRERFEFRAGGHRKGEPKALNYFDDAGELASTVRWRLFATENILWFVSDEWLFTRKPVFVLDRGALTPGVLSIEFDADVGVPISEIRLTAKAPGWTGPPGAVVQLEDLGPLNGRWLIWSHREDLDREQSDIILRRPAPTLAEPAPSLKAKSVSAVGDTGGDLAYPLAERGTFIQGPYGTGTHHAGQNWQSSNAIDVGVAVGTVVHAVDDGVISPAGTPYSNFGDTNEGGRFAGKRLHLVAGGNAWWYGHLSEITVKAGDRVAKGDPIGKSGEANGVAHLHIACEHGNPQILLGWRKT